MRGGKKHTSKPNDYTSNRFLINEKDIVWNDGCLIANLPECYLNESKLDLSVGFRSGEKQFRLQYQLPKVVDLDLVVENSVIPDSRIRPEVELKFDNGAIWKISPWGKDSIWAKCFEIYLNKELVEGNALMAPEINSQSKKNLDYFVVWKPNFAMNSSSQSAINYDVIYELTVPVRDGASRLHWDYGSHGQHGAHATALNIWLDLDTVSNLLQIKIQGNDFTESKNLFAGYGKIKILARGGNGGSGGPGYTGNAAASGSGRSGDPGGVGGDGGDGGEGANVNIYYTPETSAYLYQIEIENPGGKGGLAGSGGKGGLNDEVEETLVDVLLNGRGPRGNDGHSGRNGRSGSVDYILIK